MSWESAITGTDVSLRASPVESRRFGLTISRADVPLAVTDPDPRGHGAGSPEERRVRRRRPALPGRPRRLVRAPARHGPGPDLGRRADLLAAVGGRGTRARARPVARRSPGTRDRAGARRGPGHRHLPELRQPLPGRSRARPRRSPGRVRRVGAALGVGGPTGGPRGGGDGGHRSGHPGALRRDDGDPAGRDHPRCPGPAAATRTCSPGRSRLPATTRPSAWSSRRRPTTRVCSGPGPATASSPWAPCTPCTPYGRTSWPEDS